MWMVNREFLNKQASLGKNILFFHDPTVNYGTKFFQRELDYLKHLGYSKPKEVDGVYQAVYDGK